MDRLPSDEDGVEFLPEALDEVSPPLQSGWRILVVDDDAAVHQAVEYALRDVMVFGQRLEFLHAFSGAGAVALLRHQRDIAVVILDVVMEHEHAGLDLARKIREELCLTDTRIILHTGQPGFAPEMSVIRDYDINDYRAKTEITRNHLYTCVATAIRAYRQIRTIERSRRQLQCIVRASAELMQLTDATMFASCALRYLCLLIGAAGTGVVVFHPAAGEAYIVAGAGRFSGLLGRAPEAALERRVAMQMRESHAGGALVHSACGLALSAGSATGASVTLFAESTQRWLFEDSEVLHIFAGHLAACLNNYTLVERLHSLAYYDRLVELPNRRYLAEYLDGLTQRGEHIGCVLALLDVDDFADTNEALGHHFGNSVLLAVAERLAEFGADDCLLARVAGDVFGLLGLDERIRADALLALFARPFQIAGEESMISVTIGLARLADIEGDGGTVLEATSQALRQAKATQRGLYSWYSPSLAYSTQERVLMLKHLRHALVHRQLYVAFQPQLTLIDKRVVGMEALVRWRMSDDELIVPDRFIPIAERSGLIRQLGQYVLTQACRMQVQLGAQGYPRLRMAVNVSAVQFRHPQFVADLARTLADTGIEPACLELEMTESVAMEDAAQLQDTLSALRALGVQLAIDDFGTGYSSLSRLRLMGVDRLKIDKSFVADLASGGANGSIAHVIVQLGHRLDIAVIAEGVENEQQAAVLTRMGCEEGQGFLFARPMTELPLLEWLASHRNAQRGV